MADGKLVFLRPAEGSGKLVLGDSGGEVVAPDAEISVDAGFAGEGAAQLHLAVARLASVDAGFAGEGAADVQLQWDANVSRGGLRHELRTHWQEGEPMAVAEQSSWQQAAPLHAGMQGRWQLAESLRGGVVLPWQEAERQRAAAATRWQQGEGRRAAVLPRWQEAVRQRSAVAAHWQEGQRQRAAVTSDWQEMLRVRAAVRTHWQEAERRRAAAASGWQPALPVHVHLRPRWQEGRRPAAGVSRPDVPPVRPPCYDPARLGLLVFNTAYTGDGRIVFVCHRAGPEPEPPRYVIQLLRVYVTVHSYSAHLLPSLERVRLTDISISTDDDGYCWTLQASGPEHLLDQLAPVDGLPARVRVTVDGIDWVFAVERPERTRKFAKNRAQVRGASVTSLLGSPHMPEQAWSTNTDLTAQQLVEHALEYTGVTVDWGLTDWLVPASAWSHAGTPLSVAKRVADAAGAALRSHRTDAVLQFAPLYPHMPWEIDAATPDVSMPGHIITTDTLQHLAPARYNTVYVSGMTAGGVKGHVVIAGSAEDVPAQPIADALITHEVVARSRGRAVLGAAHMVARQSMTVPLLTGGTNPGLILPGYLIEVHEPGETWRGLVRGITVTTSMPRVRQSLIVERAA